MIAMPHRMPFALLLALCTTVAACGGATASTRTTPRQPDQVVDMEEMHITAHRGETGQLAFESYDAETLFRRATDLLNRGRCLEGVRYYDRVASEFQTSRYYSPSLYNAGLCLLDNQRYLEAEERFRTLVERVPGSSDVKDAQFQRAGILIKLERWDDALATAERLLTREDLSSEERVEAMARRAQAHFGASRMPDAERAAQETLTYYRTRPDNEHVRDPFFAAAANFIVAETLRARSQTIVIPQAPTEEQHRVLNARAAVLLQAQTEYFNTIRLTDATWAAASGYRIGAMYDDFWQAIMTSPVPPRPDLSASNRRIFNEEYRRSLADMVKPLLRHAIRYWELTLMMVERTGIRTDWSERTRADLERVRALLVGQAPGAGGVAPASTSAPDAAASPAPGGASPAPAAPAPAGSLAPASPGGESGAALAPAPASRAPAP